MNFRLFPTFVFLSLFIGSLSCSNKPNRSRKPAVQINIESVHNQIFYGDDINIAISVKLKDGAIQDTKIFVDSVLITSNKETEFSTHLKKYKNLGKHTLKAVSVKTEGTEGVYYKTFEVFSDIISEQYGFELVKTYPHNETSFTEGLEIKDGFLYERTGDYGTSFIYKTNLKTGKPLQSVNLEVR